MVEIGFKKVHNKARLPEKAHLSDAGFDVYAVEDTVLKPFTPTLVKTGLIPNIPEGYEIQVRPRSGMALKNGVTVWNAPGTVDAGYKGEIGVILLFSPENGSLSRLIQDGTGVRKELSEFKVHAGDRIAQFVVAPVLPCTVHEVEDVGESDRSKVGHDGFGSTGQ